MDGFYGTRAGLHRLGVAMLWLDNCEDPAASPRQRIETLVQVRLLLGTGPLPRAKDRWREVAARYEAVRSGVLQLFDLPDPEDL